MSETLPRTSADTEPPKHPHYIEGLPDAMQIAAIDRLRTEQAEYEQELIDKESPLDLAAQAVRRKEAQDNFDQMIRDHLKANGVAEDDDKFGEYAARLRDYSVDRLPSNVWENGPVDPDGTVHPSPRLEAVKTLTEKYGKPTTVETSEPEPTPDETKKEEDPAVPKTPEEIKATVDKDPAIIAARANVDNLRGELAALSAKRQGRLFNRKSGSLQEEYDAKRTAYETALNNLIKLELSAERTAGIERDEDQERVEVAFRLIDQFKKLQTESVELLKNTKVGKFVTWMTEGGTFKRILKGVAVGAAVGVVGAAITAFTLGTGLGAIGAGVATGAAMTGRFARGFAMADNKKGRGMDVLDSEGRDSAFNTELINQTGGDKDASQTVDAAHRILMEKFETDTKKEQGKRRKATFIALGSVALGSGLAFAANEAADHFTGHMQGISDSVHGVNLKPGAYDIEIPQPKTVIPERIFEADALRINPGEGWYQTFMDLNVPQKDWPALLDKVGPQLQGVKVDGMDLAYRMPNGEWGIRMTPDGTMPKEALNIIANGHDQMTGISTAPAPIEAPAPATPNIPPVQAEAPAGAPSAEVISAADRGSIANVIKMDVIRPADIADNAAFDKITQIASWYEPEWIAQKLELAATDWHKLEDFIAGQVKAGSNALYTEVFNVDARGYLHFNDVREIPDATMADMLNQAKRLSSIL